jgi:hypothetical protein
MSNVKNYNQDFYLRTLNNSYSFITNKAAFKYISNGKKISLEDIKNFYQGFYFAYKGLMEDKKLPKQIKMDIIAKKSIIDDFYSRNITYPNYNYVKLSKSVANKIPTNINSHNNLSGNFAKLRLKPNK